MKDLLAVERLRVTIVPASWTAYSHRASYKTGLMSTMGVPSIASSGTHRELEPVDPVHRDLVQAERHENEPVARADPLERVPTRTHDRRGTRVG